MRLTISKDRISLRKELNYLDNLVLDFVRTLNKRRIKYVLVSGYVSILFGRSRSSEDIDLISECISEARFRGLWKELMKNYDCIVPGNPSRAYRDYLLKRTSVRFCRKGDFIPNIEFMFPKAESLDRWVLENARKVVLNGFSIRISPIELQIPYKLFLGSPKDIEDARHLYKLFKGKIDQNVLKQFLIKLDKRDRFKKYLA